MLRRPSSTYFDIRREACRVVLSSVRRRLESNTVTANQNKPISPPQLGHYRLLEDVGDGRLGKVYRARDTVLGRTVLVRDAYEPVGRDSAARAGFFN